MLGEKLSPFSDENPDAPPTQAPEINDSSNGGNIKGDLERTLHTKVDMLKDGEAIDITNAKDSSGFIKFSIIKPLEEELAARKRALEELEKRPDYRRIQEAFGDESTSAQNDIEALEYKIQLAQYIADSDDPYGNLQSMLADAEKRLEDTSGPSEQLRLAFTVLQDIDTGFKDKDAIDAYRQELLSSAKENTAPQDAAEEITNAQPDSAEEPAETEGTDDGPSLTEKLLSEDENEKSEEDEEDEEDLKDTARAVSKESGKQITNLAESLSNFAGNAEQLIIQLERLLQKELRQEDNALISFVNDIMGAIRVIQDTQNAKTINEQADIALTKSRTLRQEARNSNLGIIVFGRINSYIDNIETSLRDIKNAVDKNRTPNHETNEQ